MMNNLEGYLVELLQGHLTIDDKPVEVVKQFSQHPERPVVTLDLSPGVTLQHVYSDPGVNCVYYEYHATVNINVWCDTEEQRASLTGQVMELYYKSLEHHQMYCGQYNEGVCNSHGQNCKATLNRNHCPRPTEYDYTGVLERWRIIPGTLHIDPPFDMDDPTDHPPLLRSILRCECQYSIARGEPMLVREVELGSISLVDDPYAQVSVDWPRVHVHFEVDTFNRIAFTGYVLDENDNPVGDLRVSLMVQPRGSTFILWQDVRRTDSSGCVSVGFMGLGVNLPPLFTFKAVVPTQQKNGIVYESDELVRNTNG